jgi:hypothetical protein
MGDGHHEILLLLLQVELTPNRTEYKKGAHHDQDQKSHSFTQVLGIITITLCFDRGKDLIFVLSGFLLLQDTQFLL